MYFPLYPGCIHAARDTQYLLRSLGDILWEEMCLGRNELKVRASYLPTVVCKLSVQKLSKRNKRQSREFRQQMQNNATDVPTAWSTAVLRRLQPPNIINQPPYATWITSYHKLHLHHIKLQDTSSGLGNYFSSPSGAETTNAPSNADASGSSGPTAP